MLFLLKVAHSKKQNKVYLKFIKNSSIAIISNTKDFFTILFSFDFYSMLKFFTKSFYCPKIK